MQTLSTIKKLISGVKFNDWDFNIKVAGDNPYLQITFMAPGSFTGGEPELQSCRKWMLSYHMCDEEIVSTAFKAMLAAVEHEAREQFTWEGEAIYRPHYSIRDLHALSKRNAVEKRDEVFEKLKTPAKINKRPAKTYSWQDDWADRSGYDPMAGVRR